MTTVLSHGPPKTIRKHLLQVCTVAKLVKKAVVLWLGSPHHEELYQRVAAIGKLLTTAIWLLSQEKFTLGLAQLTLSDNSSHWSLLGTSACVLPWAAHSHWVAQAMTEAEKGQVLLPQSWPLQRHVKQLGTWSDSTFKSAWVSFKSWSDPVTKWKPLTLVPYSTDLSIENLNRSSLNTWVEGVL